MPQSSRSFLPAASTRYLEPVTVPAAPKKVSFAIHVPRTPGKTLAQSTGKAKFLWVSDKACDEFLRRATLAGRHDSRRLAQDAPRGELIAVVLSICHVKAIQIHHLGPRCNEVLHKLLLGVRARIDFGESAKLRVRAENQVHPGCSPPQLVRLPVAPFVNAIRSVRVPL